MSGTIEAKGKYIFRYSLNSVLIVSFGVLIFDILYTEFTCGYEYGNLNMALFYCQGYDGKQ